MSIHRQLNMVVYICVCVGLPMHTVFFEKGNLKKKTTTKAYVHLNPS